MFLMAHSRSNSLSSLSSVSSTHSHHSHSHPRHDMASFLPVPSSDELYRASFPLGRPANSIPNNTHTRHSSTSTNYSLPSTGITSPADSPPQSGQHVVNAPGAAAAVAALKAHPSRMSHIRNARAATSPYPREPPSGSDSVHSSSSEADDIAMFLTHPAQDYALYSHPLPPQQDPSGQFGRMTLRPDQQLEQLAANVRSATTTSASDRAKQIFVQAWLNANYAPYPDGNVPRQGLYMSYRRVCDQYGIPHINTATLGKAIRLCFPTIKTRRLGVRGNSKYHYCGIRPATPAEAEWLQDYVRKSNANRPQNADASRGSAPAKSGDEGRSDDEDEEDSSEGGGVSAASVKRTSLTINGAKGLEHMDPSDKTPTAKSILTSAQSSRPSQNGFNPSARIRRSTGPEGQLPISSHPTVPSGAPAAYLSLNPATSLRDVPGFPSIEEAVGTSSTPHGMAAREVWRWFEAHLDNLLDCVKSFRFDQFELLLRTFWQNLTGEYREVVHAPAVAGLMAKADAILYDEILGTLRSQILSPIPAPALTSLRQLADKMEKILMIALENYGSTFVEPKVELGARFGHLVLRFLDIFQVTQALSTVLTSPKQVQDMRRSWHQIDFDSVRNQSALVCNCRQEDLSQLLEVDFITMLDRLPGSTEPVRDVMAWADDCCERLMGNRANINGGTEDRSTMSSRSILIRWGYVTSQIMRDLTIRSDPAFGAFQILKLFLDDWIALNVLRSVALSTNSVAASVEPPMPQQYFVSLSPMAGQEHFSTSQLDTRGAMMSQTPTTSSMLAALNDSFPSTGLDPSGAFNSGSYYMDPTSSQSTMAYPDFVQAPGAPFDVGFGHELTIGGDATDRELSGEPASEPSI